MSERKPCLRCSRPIDAGARVCPYCNWWQSETPPPPEPQPVEQAAPAPLPWWKNKELLQQKKVLLQNRAIVAVGLGAVLIIAFVIGSFVHGFGDTEIKAAQRTPASAAESSAENPKPPDNVTLVPVTGEGTAPVVEAPITSAPATGTAQGTNDTTALPSGEYAAAAARAKAQHQAEEQQRTNVTDPRALTGAPYQTAERAPRPEAPQGGGEAAPAVQRTNAFPEYKPLPSLILDREMVARLTVTVGADGRVTDIEVNEPVPQMTKVIAAVQNWRFRPATENGMAVPARVAVDIIFHGNGG